MALGGAAGNYLVDCPVEHLQGGSGHERNSHRGGCMAAAAAERVITRRLHCGVRVITAA